MAILGPFSVGFPVVFRSGGDTTRVAFGKHIQEIERIYGILNALDNDKLSASDLNAKLAGFKPSMSFADITGNLDISRITGNLDMSRISGNLDFSRITGNVPAARVSGTLSNANIAASNVTGLEAFVKNIVPSSSGGKGDGITDVDANENGYAKFANGFLIQWGSKNAPELAITNPVAVDNVTFNSPFPNNCLNIVLSSAQLGNSARINAKWGTQLIEGTLNKSGFSYAWMHYDFDEPKIGGSGIMKMHYIALGY